MRRTKGRKAEPHSRTQQAAQLAAYLVTSDSLSQREAARHGAHAFGVNADSVRKYLARLLKGPTVVLRPRPMWFGQRPPRIAPLGEVSDVRFGDEEHEQAAGQG